MSVVKSVTDWSINKFLPWGPAGLFVVSFAESSFFPVPPDIILIALALKEPRSGFYLAFITTAGSVLGAIFGYALGLIGGRPLLERFVSKEKIALVHNYFNKYEAWAIAIAGFTPIPYKLFTISGGVFYIKFTTFVIASILSRGTRFFLEGAMIFFFGEAIRHFLVKYFNIATVVFFILVIAGFYALKVIADRARKKSDRCAKIST